MYFQKSGRNSEKNLDKILKNLKPGRNSENLEKIYKNPLATLLIASTTLIYKFLSILY